MGRGLSVLHVQQITTLSVAMSEASLGVLLDSI